MNFVLFYYYFNWKIEIKKVYKNKEFNIYILFNFIIILKRHENNKIK